MVSCLATSRSKRQIVSVKKYKFNNFTDSASSNNELKSSLKSYARVNNLHDNIKTDYISIQGLANADLKDVTIKMIHFNIRSLNKNIDNLQIMLNDIGVEWDFVILTEIDNFNIDSYSSHFPNYEFTYSTPLLQKIGGIGIYFNKEIKINEILFNQINNADCETITIRYKKYNYMHILTGIYRHPNTNIEQFSINIEEYLTNINKVCSNHIVIGDVNINLMDYNNKNIKKYSECIQNSNLEIISTLPTRITENSVTIIDHTYLSKNLLNKMTRIHYGNIKETFTDHQPNYLFYFNKPNCKARPLVRIMSKNNYAKFLDKIKNTSWSTIVDLCDINQKFTEFLSILQKCYDDSFPIVRMSRKTFKDKNWITDKIKKMIHIKYKLYNYYKKHLWDQIAGIEYKVFCNKLQCEINTAKQKYYNEIFNNRGKQSKSYWNIINKLIGKDKAHKQIRSNIYYNGRTYSDDQEIANVFNTFYVEITEKLKENIPNHKDLPHIFNKNYNSMFLLDTNETEVMEIILKLKNNKTNDCNNLNTNIIKSIANEITSTITHLINTSFNTGIFPQSLKLSRVVPIYKDHKHTDPNNYRPITITNTISKIIEKIMKKRLVNYLTSNRLLNEDQYGFRKGSNTLFAIMNILHRAYKAIDNKEKVGIIFLDLSKAFDMVDHELLLNKLETLGIRGLVYNWFKTYLIGREQYVQIGKKKSDKKYIINGVPQGSVLGPILYNIYINDFKDYIKNDNVTFFADDTAYIETDKNMTNLNLKINRNLELINQYFRDNKLLVNYSKTNYLLIGNNINKLNTNIFTNTHNNFSIVMGNEKITETSFCKYLGLIIDNKLNWKNHISMIIKKLNKFIPLFYIFRKFMNIQMMVDIFQVMVKPTIIYCIEIFGAKATTEYKLLQKKINKIIDIIYNENSTQFDYNSKIREYLNLEYIKKMKYCNLIHQVLYSNDIPLHIKKIYTGKLRIHNKSTRKKNNIYIDQINTTIFKNSFIHQSRMEWNKLCSKVQDIVDNKIFKKQLNVDS